MKKTLLVSLMICTGLVYGMVPRHPHPQAPSPSIKFINRSSNPANIIINTEWSVVKKRPSVPARSRFGTIGALQDSSHLKQLTVDTTTYQISDEESFKNIARITVTDNGIETTRAGSPAIMIRNERVTPITVTTRSEIELAPNASYPVIRNHTIYTQLIDTIIINGQTFTQQNLTNISTITITDNGIQLS